MRLSQRALSIQESAIRKLDAAVAKNSHVHYHKLNIGQPDVPTPQVMLDALAREDGKVIAYGPASGTAECREAAADWMAHHVSPGVTKDHLVVTQGGSEALLFAFCALCDPGDEILVPEPYYTNYNGFATVAAARVKPIRTRIEDGFAIPSDEELDKYVTDRTRIFLFSNPGNPTGAIYDRATVQRVAAWAKRRGLWLVADEVYRFIYFDQKAPSVLELTDHQDHAIVIDSMSKTFSACGLRIGFLVSRNLDLMEKVERLGQARLGPQPRAQKATVAALKLPASYYEEVRTTYQKRVNAMMDALAKLPGVSFPRPKGAFYSMVRLPVKDTEAFARFMVEEFRDSTSGKEESVVVAPGPGFYADPSSGRDEVRVAAVRDEKALSRAVEVLGRGLVAYREKHPGR